MAEPIPNNLDGDSREEALLRSALADVPIPSGLAMRLKSALHAHHDLSTASVPSASKPADVGVAECEIGQPSAAQCRMAEREVECESLRAASLEPAIPALNEVADTSWVRRSFIALVLAAGIAGFAFLANRWTRPAEPSWLASQCDLILEKLERENPASWQPVDQASANIPAAVKSQLARVAFVAQQSMSRLNPKSDGLVYRLDAGDGRGIVLMRLQGLPAVRGLTSRFEVLPTPSGGWSLVAMSVGNETYVLAAACTEQQIFHYIRRLALT